jgi:hypothetical protein
VAKRTLSQEDAQYDGESACKFPERQTTFS